MTEPYTIAEFCRVHHICRATFYKMVREGSAPRLLRIRRRILITPEAVEEWRRLREAA